MKDFEEYAFILPDGSLRYEMIDLNAPLQEQIDMFMEMHGARDAARLSTLEKRAPSADL